ncbi:MAG: DCC1-like thiol-disulfide oxidoreductase family protein [Terracidiphilus sp.]|jgi:predicted DCC family thiol-disulfide oxidoreductase YuxK
MRGPLEIGDRLLVIFDGHCGLCNRSVRWFLARDRRDRLRFAPYESPKVAGVLARHGIGALEPVVGPSTVLVVLDLGSPAERLLIRSDGVLTILRELPGPWPAVATVLGWVPRAVRDLGYRLIARWRHRIWGRLESCPLPTTEERGRFL